MQRRWTGGFNYGPWTAPADLSPDLGGGGEASNDHAGEVGPVRDILGWGIQGSYGEGVIFNRDVVEAGMRIGGVGAGEDSWRYIKAFFVAAVLNVVLVIWVADLFWRGVGRRCVRFARAVERWVCGKRL